MGSVFSADVVVGVRISDIFNIETISEEVTKYNPDTGVPYKILTHKRKFFLFGREIAEPVEPHPGEWKALSILGLKVYSTGSSSYRNGDRYDYDMFVLGIPVAEANDLNYGGGVYPVADIGINFKRFSEAIGPRVEGMKSIVVPGLYLVCYAS